MQKTEEGEREGGDHLFFLCVLLFSPSLPRDGWNLRISSLSSFRPSHKQTHTHTHSTKLTLFFHLLPPPFLRIVFGSLFSLTYSLHIHFLHIHSILLFSSHIPFFLFVREGENRGPEPVLIILLRPASPPSSLGRINRRFQEMLKQPNTA